MEVPPDKEMVFVCHCRPGRRPEGYVPEWDNEGDDALVLVENTVAQNRIRLVSDEAHFVDTDCPDKTMTRNKWSDVPDGTIQIVWGQHCPVYSGDKKTLEDILAAARSKLTPAGIVVFPAYSPAVKPPVVPDGWTMEMETFPFLVKSANSADKAQGGAGVFVFTKMITAGRRTRRKTLKQRLAAAKKKCYPGYEVYDYRMNSKGEFFNCAPAGLKRRRTRRRA